MNPVKRNIGRAPKKKMQGPKKFVKTQSKRKSPPRQKTIDRFTKKPRSSKVSASRGNYAITPITTKKVVKKRTTFVSTLAPGLERLEKYMAQSGIASRREAKDLITKRLVTVNGKVAREPGMGIDPTKDKVKVTGGVLESKETLLFYKPRGIETTKTSPDATDIHDKFPQFKHLAPVGRLDKDSEGLILLSNDGVLAKVVTGENSKIDKEYQVTVREDVMPALLSRMESGIMLDKVMTLPCLAEKVSRNEYRITLQEGRKHQVRRMANACKLTVTRLVRIRIGDFTIGKMTPGYFKKIPNAVVDQMKKQ